MKVYVPGWHQWINHTNHLYSLKRSCQEATLCDIMRVFGPSFFMILWQNKIEHPPGFVEKLEKQIISQHDSKSYFTTYIDGLHKNDPILDEDLDNHINCLLYTSDAADE